MITNETELNLYKITSMWNIEHYIIAESFQELAQDLKDTETEPDKIEMIETCYLNNKLINRIKKEL
jgi:macrodomain Ter protein organizer (MatP/YcbG family)